MDDTIRRLARVLGAQGVESAGPDSRFLAQAADGSKLKVSIEGAQQRLMAVLTGPDGVTRVDLDVAPLKKVTEDSAFPGRVTLHLGSLQIHLDSKPTLAVEVVTDVK